MTTTLNFTPSAAHAKRAKLGEHVGHLCYGNPRAGEADTVDYTYWTITKVFEDGRLRVTDTKGRNKTLKPDGKRGNRFVWFYTETQPYRSNVICAIQTRKDREKRDAEHEKYRKRQRAEERARKRQHKRNQPMYDKLVAFADARGLLLSSASTGQYRLRPARYEGETHASMEQLLIYAAPETDLGHYGVEMPVEVFLSLADL